MLKNTKKNGFKKYINMLKKSTGRTPWAPPAKWFGLHLRYWFDQRLTWLIVLTAGKLHAFPQHQS